MVLADVVLCKLGALSFEVQMTRLALTLLVFAALSRWVLTHLATTNPQDVNAR